MRAVVRARAGRETKCVVGVLRGGDGDEDEVVQVATGLLSRRDGKGLSMLRGRVLRGEVVRLNTPR